MDTVILYVTLSRLSCAEYWDWQKFFIYWHMSFVLSCQYCYLLLHISFYLTNSMVLYMQKSPFLSGIDEHERTHINQRFIIADTIAEILQERQWHCHCTAPTQQCLSLYSSCEMACLNLLVTLLTAWNVCTVFCLSTAGIVVITWIQCHLSH
jgi:hypothetical protein